MLSTLPRAVGDSRPPGRQKGANLKLIIKGDADEELESEGRGLGPYTAHITLV